MFRESGYLYLILMDSSVERNESFSETGMLCLFGKYPSFENVEAVLRCLPVPEPEEFNHPNTPPPMTTHLVKEYEKRISKKPKLAEEKMNVLIQATRTEKGPLLLEEENVRTNPPLTSHQNEYTDHDGTRKHKDKWALSVRSNLGPRGRAFAQYFSLHPTLKVKVNHVGEFSLQPGFEVQYLARRQPVPNNLSVTFKFFGEEYV